MDGSMKGVYEKLYPGQPAGAPGARSLRERLRLTRVGACALVAFKLFVIGMFVFYWNQLVTLSLQLEGAKADVDCLLDRRRNIVESLKVLVSSYKKHERAIFEYAASTRLEMVESRSPAGAKGPASPPPGKKPEASKRADDLDGALSRAFAFAERYPELRASEPFQRFMEALVDVENRVAEKQLIHNARQVEMAVFCERFPACVFARLYGFAVPPSYKSHPDAHRVPGVE